MKKSLFGAGFGQRPFMGGWPPPQRGGNGRGNAPGETPLITLAVNFRDINPNYLKDWLRNILPPGWVGAGPRVVKILDGEFLVYPDGSAQFVQVGRNPGPRFDLAPESMAERMFPEVQEFDPFRQARPTYGPI